MTLFGAALLSCSEQRPDASEIRAFVSILPQIEIVRRIGGDCVHVQALVAPGQSAETYAPTPAQLTKLARADLFFRIGVPFEDSLLPRIADAMKDIRIVDTREGVALRNMEEGIAVEHDESDAHVGHGHAHLGKDPHIWLDPLLVVRQAQTVRDAFIALAPDHRTVFEANYQTFEAELRALDAELRELLAPVQGSAFFVFHPAYGYFADRYGLRQIAVETQGKDPGPRDLARFMDMAREQGVRVIFAQPQFSQKSAHVLAEAIGGTVVPLDDLAPDVMSNLRAMAGEIRSALDPDGAGQE